MANIRLLGDTTIQRLLRHAVAVVQVNQSE